MADTTLTNGNFWSTVFTTPITAMNDTDSVLVKAASGTTDTIITAALLRAYLQKGIGFATNGGDVANRFQTLGGAQLLQLLAYGTVTGSSSGATLSDTYCMTGSISVSRSGEGVYTVSGLNMSDSNYFHRVIAYGTTNNMKVTVYNETWNQFTAEVSDDASTNDSNFRFMVVGYRKY